MYNLKSIILAVISVLVISLNSGRAQARFGTWQMVPVGLGYSAPAVNTTLPGAENPAGLPTVGGTQLVISAGTTSNSSTTAGSFLNWGNSDFGLALGARTYTPSGGEQLTRVQGGLGGVVSSLNTALGVSGSSTSSGNDSSAYLGILVNPEGSHRLAITNSATNTFGLGYSYFGQSFILTLDATALKDAATFGPGLMFDGGTFQFAITQIIHQHTTTESADPITRIALAFGNPSLMLGLYYNYISTYAAALTMVF